jgi:hypothetical protein
VSTSLAREARSQTSRPTWRTSFRERLGGVQPRRERRLNSSQTPFDQERGSQRRVRLFGDQAPGDGESDPRSWRASDSERFGCRSRRSRSSRSTATSSRSRAGRFGRREGAGVMVGLAAAIPKGLFRAVDDRPRGYRGAALRGRIERVWRSSAASILRLANLVACQGRGDEVAQLRVVWQRLDDRLGQAASVCQMR